MTKTRAVHENHGSQQKPSLITVLYSRTRQNTINQVRQITNQTTQQSVQH